MEQLITPASTGLSGQVVVPGDKSISHRSLIFASIADGESHITNVSAGLDVASTAAALSSCGAQITASADVTTIVGVENLTSPTVDIDCGNSGTSMRLLSGLFASHQLDLRMIGDESLSRRPMDRVCEPLREMGASIRGEGATDHPPLTLQGRPLSPIVYGVPVPSAQVKSAVLLAGLNTPGKTLVIEPQQTRTHTEDMLRNLCNVQIVSDEQNGLFSHQIVGPQRPTAFTYQVPGDPSQAAFWVVAASIVEGSELSITDLYVGPGRLGFLRVLADMNADLMMLRMGEVGHLTVKARALKGTKIDADRAASYIDEVPVIAIAAAFAEGKTRLCGLDELRHKESDRLIGTANMVVALGGKARVDGDDLVIEGTGQPLAGGAEIDPDGDHRMAMSAAVCGLGSREGVTVKDWSVVATSYPNFGNDLSRCTS